MAGGKASRRKGDRVERKVRDAFREAGVVADRVPLSGAAGGEFGGDLRVLVPGLGTWTVEIKARAAGDGWKVIAGWLDGNDALVLAQDRSEPLVVLPWKVWREVLKNLRGDTRDDSEEEGVVAGGEGGPGVPALGPGVQP